MASAAKSPFRKGKPHAAPPPQPPQPTCATGQIASHPPNLSLPHPYTTPPMPRCASAPAHMIQGSHVTYSVASFHLTDASEPPWKRMAASTASNSQCRVP